MRFILPLLLALPLTAMAGQVYRWVDAEGQVNYSQTPPPSLKAESVRPAPQATANPGLEAMRRFNAEADKNSAADAEAKKKLAATKAEQDRICTAARRQATTLEQRPPNRIARKDQQGNYVRMTPEEHAQALSKARTALSQNNCP